MKKNFHISLIFTCVFLFSLWSLAAADDAWVYGHVYGFRTGEPIEGAELNVWEYPAGDTVGSDITGSDGYYWIQMDVTLTDTFVVEASALGHRAETGYFAPDLMGDSVEIDFRLKSPYLLEFDSSLVEDQLCWGDSSVFKRAMKNVGRVTFEFTVLEDADWIVVDPTSGSIPYFNEDTLFIWLYALEPLLGVLEDTIIIDNNSPSPAIHIPVELGSYAPGPYIEVDASPIFDTLDQGLSGYEQRTMANMGCEDLTFNVDVDVDWLDASPRSGTILPMGGSRDLTITWDAPQDTSGTLEGQVTINNNSTNNPTVVIDVTIEVTIAGVEGRDGKSLPSSFALRPCYPNPFNASTSIGYDLPRASLVKLEVYNLVGQKVATLVDDYQRAGYKTINWDAAEFTTGIYYYKLTAGDFISVRKMTILK